MPIPAPLNPVSFQAELTRSKTVFRRDSVMEPRLFSSPAVLRSSSSLQEDMNHFPGSEEVRSLNYTLSPTVLIPQHFLYFLPLPQGQGSFRPTFGAEDTCGRRVALDCRFIN